MSPESEHAFNGKCTTVYRCNDCYTSREYHSAVTPEMKEEFVDEE